MISETDRRIARQHRCEQSHLDFTRYFFKFRQAIKFRVNWHHQIIADALQDVLDGKTKRLLINVAPGSSKTELAVVNFIARGLALNPRARFLHLSYSDDVALQNSQNARELVSSEEYQEFWPLKIADDSKAKKRWNVLLDGKPAGGVYATSLGGQVTGFRAGHMAEGFQGALIIDDPMKPEDAFSKPKLKVANRRLLSTVKSRLANPDVPIIVIMQRIAEEDQTGFILAGHLGKGWRRVCIPALVDEKYIDTLAAKYAMQVVREKGRERFSYWPYKEPTAELLAMERGEGNGEDGAKMSRHVFSSQYQQNPVALGGNIIRGGWFGRYKLATMPKIKYRKMYADTAQKTKERNDYSVFECWGLGEDDKLYLIDLIRGKWEAPDLEKRCIEFWNKHKNIEMGIIQKDRKLGQLRKLEVEDKASGTGLIQKIRMLGHIPVGAIERNKDKLTRVMDVLGYIEAGMLMVPEDATFTNDFIEECEAFTADDTHAHDDQIDPMVDAAGDMLSTRNKLELWKSII